MKFTFNELIDKSKVFERKDEKNAPDYHRLRQTTGKCFGKGDENQKRSGDQTIYV